MAFVCLSLSLVLTSSSTYPFTVYTCAMVSSGPSSSPDKIRFATVFNNSYLEEEKKIPFRGV